MEKNKDNPNKIERVVIKIPKAVADYYRSTFSHGTRSEFVARCILEYKHKQEVELMEDNLRSLAKKRQDKK